MSKFLILALIFFVASVYGDDYNCPSSGSSVHAGCKVQTSFSNSCSEVQDEIKKRISGQHGGDWVDPHNNGTYTLVSETPQLFELTRLTGNGKYTDKINFVFSDADGNQCDVHACSESQVFSIGDGGTNFCNIHDLYCSESGCGGFNKLTYEEKAGKCTEANAKVCIA